MTRPLASRADRDAIQAEMPWTERGMPATVYGMLERTAAKFGARPAVSFQLFSEATAHAETLTWSALKGKIARAANLFRSLGVGPDDTVAYVLPNCNEAVITFIAGVTAGRVAPINPLLEPEKIAGILRQTEAKVVVTLRGFPKTDVAEKVAQAISLAPNVEHVLEVDLLRYVTGIKKFIIPFIRPKVQVHHRAKVQDFNAAMGSQSDTVAFDLGDTDRICALFHTGGTTGLPKVAMHRQRGLLYNGWIGSEFMMTSEDTFICPLPMFHVFAAYPAMMSALCAGAHVVMPTPAGYRGEGVFDNFWKLVERWKASFIITVPTAMAALMQRPVNADVSSLRSGISGSAPLPLELYRRFEEATGVQIVEGYGLTEATCLISCNPIVGEKRVGSVGLPFPYTDVRILHCAEDGTILKECATGETGEICVLNPGVNPDTYSDDAKNRGLLAGGTHLRTGDLGKLDDAGYLWITGRAKDLIIRGGHNIDPAMIEEALLGHPLVAFAGAIGQPDSVAGELPCVYVELVGGANATVDELLDYAREHIAERAAFPKHLEILPELPKTAVGKIFKPDLRRLAITRVLDERMALEGIAAHVASVIEDPKRGLIAQVTARGASLDEGETAKLRRLLGEYPVQWEIV